MTDAPSLLPFSRSSCAALLLVGVIGLFAVAPASAAAYENLIDVGGFDSVRSGADPAGWNTWASGVSGCSLIRAADLGIGTGMAVGLANSNGKLLPRLQLSMGQLMGKEPACFRVGFDVAFAQVDGNGGSNFTITLDFNREKPDAKNIVLYFNQKTADSGKAGLVLSLGRTSVFPLGASEILSHSGSATDERGTLTFASPKVHSIIIEMDTTTGQMDLFHGPHGAKPADMKKIGITDALKGKINLSGSTLSRIILGGTGFASMGVGAAVMIDNVVINDLSAK